MSESVVVEARGHRISAIWVVPLIAVVLGIWLAVDAYLSQGPTIVVHFSSAQAIAPDKTRVKVRDVEIGTVTEVRLADDLNGVLVTAELDPQARRLLREDTQIWVVKPEVRGVSVSGLGTLLSGAYVEIAPGVGKLTNRREFEGLDQRPVSPAGTPGKRLRLVSGTAGSVSVGSPILYRGYRVGAVESIDLDVDTREVAYSILIDAPYDQLVTSKTRFWNASGVSAELSSEGIKLSIGSLQSALMGGVSFDLPRNSRGGRTVTDGAEFKLYPDEASINENPYNFSREYVVAFSQSLRGLNPDAPVMYRGIKVGSVIRIMLDDFSVPRDQESAGEPIPVLVRLEPGRLALDDSEDGLARMQQAVQHAVRAGLRAKLVTGNLLTGSMYIETEYFDDHTPRELGEYQGYPTIPTISGGLDHLQVQVSELLEKLNQLPLKSLVGSAADAVAELEGTLVAIRRVMESEEVKAMPMNVQAVLNNLNDVLAGFDSDSEFQRELIRTLEELKQTLQSVDAFADQLEERPNSLIFPAKTAPDPEPGARR